MILPPFELQHPKGRGKLHVELIEEHGELIAGVFNLTGKLDLPPKQWLRVMRETMREFERQMKAGGVKEVRVAGRDWSRVLTDYKPIAGGKSPNLIGKRL